MEYFLITVSFLLLITGVIGSILPILPGPPISWVGFLLASFTPWVDLSTQWLILTAMVTIVITILDFYIPVWGTKRFGGTKYGTNGSTIGMIIGLIFFPPFGIIFGPFIGAFIGEIIHDGTVTSKALKSAMGAFMGFILGTGMKLGLSLFMLFICLKELL